MKFSSTLLFTAGLVALSATQASALTVLIDQTNLGNSSSQQEQAWLQSSVLGYNSANGADLPTQFSQYVANIQIGNVQGTTFNFTLPSEYDFAYVLLKWGGGQKNPASHQLWYTTESAAFVSPIYTTVNGAGKTNTHQPSISHYSSVLGTIPGDIPPPAVPDHGGVLALLAPMLIGLVWFRRRQVG